MHGFEKRRNRSSPRLSNRLSFPSPAPRRSVQPPSSTGNTFSPLLRSSAPTDRSLHLDRLPGRIKRIQKAEIAFQQAASRTRPVSLRNYAGGSRRRVSAFFMRAERRGLGRGRPVRSLAGSTSRCWASSENVVTEKGLLPRSMLLTVCQCRPTNSARHSCVSPA